MRGVVVKDAMEALLGFFYPPVCQLCGEERASAKDGYLGERCRRSPGGIRFVEPPFCAHCGLPFDGAIGATFECANCRESDLRFRYARAAVVATPVLMEMIRRYKYHHATWFEPLLGDLLVQAAAPELRSGNYDLLVPVPLHPVRRREREYNQAERLAARLGRSTGLPLNTHALVRVEPTPTQTRLSRSERARNVSRAFVMAARWEIRSKRVVIVDDVLTTGATTSACARVLRAAGARDVVVWTLARGLAHAA